MSHLFEKVERYGQWTYRAAWALEICAATIGLATGIFLGYRAFSASEDITTSELILASAPFFMVALAELTKIPIATLLYATSWIWKPVLFVILFALAFITFETVFTGLERATTLRQLAYQEFVDQIQIKQKDLATFEAEIALLERSSDTAELQAEIETLQRSRDAELDSTDKSIGAIDDQIARYAVFSPEHNRLTDAIEEKKNELRATIEQRDGEIDRRVAEFQSQRDSYVERMKECAKQGDTKCFKEYDALVKGLVNPRPTIGSEYAPRIEELRNDIRGLQAERDRIGLEARGENRTRLQGLEAQKQRLLEQRDQNEERWQGRIDGAIDRLQKLQAGQLDRDDRVLEKRERIAAVNSEINELEKQRIPMARQDQVRRLAGWWFGANPEDVTDEQATFIGLIWFGSLSIMAALAGPLTAMVALGLQSIGERRSSERESPLARFLRRWLVDWRFRRVRTVTKTVEKPVETTVKEILYVPIFTDDPEAMRKFIGSDLPEEVRDAVSMAVAGFKQDGEGKAQHRASGKGA